MSGQGVIRDAIFWTFLQGMMRFNWKRFWIGRSFFSGVTETP